MLREYYCGNQGGMKKWFSGTPLVATKAYGKLFREFYDTLRNRIRSLGLIGLKFDDNPSLSMVLLPIFETKLSRELKEKWELELTKYETEEEDKDIDIKQFFQFLVLY